MRHMILPLAAALALSAPARAADDAAAIIDKAIKAYGGADVLNKQKAMQWKSKGVAHVMGIKLDYTADYSVQFPDKMRFDMDASVMDMKIAISAATDGKAYWEKAMGKVQDMPEKKAKAFKQQLYAMSLSMLTQLKGKEYTLSASGEEKVEGKPALGVLISRKGQPDVTLFFDKESGLIAKMKMQAWDEFTDKDVDQEVFFLNYKDKDGTKVFEKMTIKRDGKLFIEEEMSDMKLSDKLDAKLFEKP